MHTTRAPNPGRPTEAQPGVTDGADHGRSRAWANAIDALPHPLHLYKSKFSAAHEPALQRVALLAGSPITAQKWAALDRSARQEVVGLLSRTGVSVADLAPRGHHCPGAGRGRGAGDGGAKEGIDDGFSNRLDLNWARLVDDLPFNLYYNTVNPSYIPAAHREDVDKLADRLTDTSPLDLPGFRELAPIAQHALIYKRIRFHLDPNSSSPITNDEWQAMKPEARQEVLALLQDSGFGLAHFQRPKARQSHAGRAVKNVAPADSGGGDDRQLELTSSVTSLANIVTPIVSRALTPGADKDQPGTFDFERNRIVDEASNFLVTRYYGFERQDYIDRLIAAAKRNVKVEVEMHPPQTATRRRAQQAAWDKLKAAQRRDPTVRKNLSVAESTIVPHDPDRDYPQIMHEKSVIADTPDGTLVELQGGINGGNNSPNNLDYAMRIEGSAVHDALRKYLSFRSSAHEGLESVAEAMIRSVPRDVLDKRVVAKANHHDVPLTKVALGGGGRRRVPSAESYPPDVLLRRAEAGLSISLSIHDVARFTHVTEAGNPRWGLNDALSDVLTTALRHRSAVTVTTPSDDEDIDRAHYLAIKHATAPLRKLGAFVGWDDTVIRDVSYKNLVYENLDLAIERGESCEVAAFALTDKGVMERIVELHRKLRSVPEADRPPVRVAVHELEIDDLQVNQKVVALTTAGVDVRVFTDKDAVHIARKLSQELGVPIDAEDIKLHAKGMILGRTAVGGEPVDPRTAHGSANFSDSGFERNVEGGRFYHHPSVVDQIKERVFDEIFASCRPVEKLQLVPLAHRQGVFQDVALDTRIEDLSFMAYDLETTGFAAHFGDVPVSMAALRESLQKTENADGTVTWSRSEDRIGELNARARLGFNAFGSEQKVPKTSADIHGLTRDKLKDEPPLQDALERFKSLVDQEGKVAVPVAHNTKFDAPFLDLQYAKPEHAVAGLNLEVVDVPSICTMELAKLALPFKKKEDRAEGEPRQSYKLTKLAEQLAGRTQSEVHDAYEDVDLALDVLVGLANKMQARTLRDLLPTDKLYLDQPGSSFAVFAEPTGDRQVAQFNNETDPRVSTTHGRNLTDGSEMLGAPRKITDHRVLGFQGDRVEVELTTGRGEKAQTVRGWVDADQVRFYQGGATYWGMRQAGQTLRLPWQMSRGEFWRQETEAAAAVSATYVKKGPTMSDDRRASPDGRRSGAVAAQLASAEAALARAKQKADDAEAEATKLGRIADEARRFAEQAREQHDLAASRVDTLRSILDKGPSGA